MLACKIYKTEIEVPTELSKFSVSIDELRDVVKNTLAERSSCVDIDILSAKGQISHIIGTRYLRFLFLQKGWIIKRFQNVETIAHPDSGVQIAYQNVDLAACGFKDPKPISAKGRGSEALVDNAQGSLFGETILASYKSDIDASKLNKSIWYLCVSFHEGDRVRAEISLPKSIKDGKFNGFINRIFLIENDDWQSEEIVVERDQFEIEPQIKRKI